MKELKIALTDEQYHILEELSKLHESFISLYISEHGERLPVFDFTKLPSCMFIEIFGKMSKISDKLDIIETMIDEYF